MGFAVFESARSAVLPETPNNWQPKPKCIKSFVVSKERRVPTYSLGYSIFSLTENNEEAPKVVVFERNLQQETRNGAANIKERTKHKRILDEFERGRLPSSRPRNCVAPDPASSEKYRNGFCRLDRALLKHIHGSIA